MVDPLFTLHSGGGGSVTSVCFVRGPPSTPFSLDGRRGGRRRRRRHYSGSGDDDDNRRGVDGDESDSSRGSGASSSSSSSDDGDGEDLVGRFRCSRLLLSHHPSSDVRGRRPRGTKAKADDAVAAAASRALDGSILASCHADGSAALWDLGTRRVVSEFGDGKDDDDGRIRRRIRGPGLALRRIGDGNGGDSGGKQWASRRFLYHTRGEGGIVSIHDLEDSGRRIGGVGGRRAPQTRSILELKTGSRTFCAAAPCAGGGDSAASLVALPSADSSFATVRDLRVDPCARPAAMLHGAGINGGSVEYDDEEEEGRRHGMLMSLAMCASPSDAGNPRPILGCGMESGTVFFHDLAMVGRGPLVIKENDDRVKTFDSLMRPPPPRCSVRLGKDPVLCLDLANSGDGDASKTCRRSVLAVAGCAGDAVELCNVPEEERGTVVVIKATLDSNRGAGTAATARVRARASTCAVGVGTAGGKPGVGTCRFRPDGRVFGAGGWDRRLRVFGRTSARPIAVARGHEGSIMALDWSPDSAASGMVATGSGDGRLSVWRILTHSDEG